MDFYPIFKIHWQSFVDNYCIEEDGVKHTASNIHAKFVEIIKSNSNPDIVKLCYEFQNAKTVYPMIRRWITENNLKIVLTTSKTSKDNKGIQFRGLRGKFPDEKKTKKNQYQKELKEKYRRDDGIKKKQERIPKPLILKTKIYEEDWFIKSLLEEQQPIPKDFINQLNSGVLRIISEDREALLKKIESNKLKQLGEPKTIQIKTTVQPKTKLSFETNTFVESEKLDKNLSVQENIKLKTIKKREEKEEELIISKLPESSLQWDNYLINNPNYTYQNFKEWIDNMIKRKEGSGDDDKFADEVKHAKRIIKNLKFGSKTKYLIRRLDETILREGDSERESKSDNESNSDKTDSDNDQTNENKVEIINEPVNNNEIKIKKREIVKLPPNSKYWNLYLDSNSDKNENKIGEVIDWIIDYLSKKKRMNKTNETKSRFNNLYGEQIKAAKEILETLNHLNSETIKNQLRELCLDGNSNVNINISPQSIIIFGSTEENKVA